jgi:hypothetical protein
MSSGNAGVDTLNFLIRIAWWFIKLIPNIVRLIFRGIKGLINMFKKKSNENKKVEE